LLLIYSKSSSWHKASPDLYLQTIDKKGDVISNVYLTNLNGDATSFCTIDKDLKIQIKSAYPDESMRRRINKKGKVSGS
jgi:hypothetical protein